MMPTPSTSEPAGRVYMDGGGKVGHKGREGK